ncbi:Protein SOSEKI 5 [Linum grandiflorum]
MAVSSRGRNTDLLRLPRKWSDREPTPDRLRVWGHNNNNNAMTSDENGAKLTSPEITNRVAVVYYLSRNGQLEHPHFMEVPLSSPDGLHLRDVLNRLNLLRGKGMASLYSWSSKRSYKSGFVWHDLAEDDFIYPAHGNEYVLKGSELPEPSPPLVQSAEDAFRSLKVSAEIHGHHKPSSSSASSDELVAGPARPAIVRRRNQSWSSVDLSEYKVYKAEPFSQSSRRLAADAATQTDDKRRRRRAAKLEEEEEEQEGEIVEELVRRPERESREEIEIGIGISPPPSDSSPETLETLMKADRRMILKNIGVGKGADQNPNHPSAAADGGGKMKASTVLMQLISCGSISFRDCGATAVKEQGLSLIGQYKGRLPRGVGDHHLAGGSSSEIRASPGVILEDKEYFSGSLIETKKKQDFPGLKRSNSYNADRVSQLQMEEKAEEVVRGRRSAGGATKCIPRKQGKAGSRKEEEEESSRSGSKRFEMQKYCEESSKEEVRA